MAWHYVIVLQMEYGTVACCINCGGPSYGDNIFKARTWEVLEFRGKFFCCIECIQEYAQERIKQFLSWSGMDLFYPVLSEFTYECEDNIISQVRHCKNYKTICNVCGKAFRNGYRHNIRRYLGTSKEMHCSKHCYDHYLKREQIKSRFVSESNGRIKRRQIPTELIDAKINQIKLKRLCLQLRT